ncbi:hypothetical protein HK405_016104, partial [Cladochytrium tenue]
SSTSDEPSTDASTPNQATTSDTSETDGATDTGASDSTSSSAAGGITINPQSSGASSTANADSMATQSTSSTDSGSSPSSSSGSTSSASTSSSSGISSGAVAGVAVAVVIIAAAIVGGLFLFIRRRSDAKAAASSTFPRGLDWSADAAAGNRSGTPPGGSRSRSDSSSALLERGLGDGNMSQISGDSSNMMPINAGQAPHTVALAGAGGARAGVVPAAVAMPPPAASFQSPVVYPLPPLPDSPVPDAANYATVPTGQPALDRQLSVASSTVAASSVVVAAPGGPSPHRSASGRANAPDTASIQLPAEP